MSPEKSGLPDGIALRAATLADVPALARLGRDSFTAAFGHLYAQRDLEAFLSAVHSEAAVRGEMTAGAVVYRLAERAGALVGFAKLILASGFDAPGEARRPIDLGQLYCAAGETGRGTGGALMEWAVAEARRRGADELRLSVWSGNHGAQRFYRRHGFVHVADIDFWVGDHRDDEYLYSLKL